MDQVRTSDDWDSDVEQLSDDEVEWLLLGPWAGGVPGLVRRVRRVLDVSQRGLAAILGVSQSRVARWETGRTSPTMELVQEMLRQARLELTLRGPDGEVVEPMRDDGARDRQGRRHPAHVDLRAVAWWTPRGSSTSAHHPTWTRLSKARRHPAISYRLCPAIRRIERRLRGTPIDHPSVRQLAAEVEWVDEQRHERGRAARERRQRLQRRWRERGELSA